MARLTFSARISSLSGIFDFSEDEAVQHIYNGIIDVCKALLKKNPVDLDQFAVTEIRTEAPFNIESGMILSLRRKLGTFVNDQSVSVDDYRGATKVNVSSFLRTQDTSSLLYQSKYNPVYTVERDRVAGREVTINVSPAISSSEPVKVSYILLRPLGSANGDSYELLKVNAHSYLESIPDQYLHPIMLYAAIKVLQKRMSTLILEDEDIELEAGLKSRASELVREYEEYLGISDPPPAQQPQTRRAR